jgi:hypothetical protein
VGFVVYDGCSRNVVDAAFLCLDQAQLLFLFTACIVNFCLALLSNVPLCFPGVIGSLNTGSGTKFLSLQGCDHSDLNLLLGDARLHCKPALPT